MLSIAWVVGTSVVNLFQQSHGLDFDSSRQQLSTCLDWWIWKVKLSRSALLPFLLWKQKPVLPWCYPWRYRKDYLTLGLKPRKLICLQSQATDVFLLPSTLALHLTVDSGSIRERGICVLKQEWCGSELSLLRTLPKCFWGLAGKLSTFTHNTFHIKSANVPTL